MIKSGMRGGVSCITHRYAEASNKYMDNYDPNKENSDIMYLDANNLYGSVMSTPLPVGNFRWGKDRYDPKRYGSGSSHQERLYVGSKLFKKTGGKGYELMAMHVLKPNLVLNRPVYIGMLVLDLSKTVMSLRRRV